MPDWSSGGRQTESFRLTAVITISAAARTRGESPARSGHLSVEEINTRILLLGQHGSGKGTLGQALERVDGYLFISAGSLIRRELAERVADAIGTELAAGRDAPPELSYSLLREAIASTAASAGTLVLDGFPRHPDQIGRLRDALSGDPDLILVLDAPTALLVHRIRTRLVCGRCDRVYGAEVWPTTPSVCDDCAVDLSRRAEDDDTQAIARRHEVWTREGAAILQALQPLAPVVRVDASKPPDGVLDAARLAIAALQGC
jgi:adenylate kinase